MMEMKVSMKLDTVMVSFRHKNMLPPPEKSNIALGWFNMIPMIRSMIRYWLTVVECIQHNFLEEFTPKFLDIFSQISISIWFLDESRITFRMLFMNIWLKIILEFADFCLLVLSINAFIPKIYKIIYRI